MSSGVLDIDGYLKRVGLASLPAATPEGLAELVRAQSYSIAFENLDALAGIPVRLDPASIVDKLVRRGRGGYCYELNGLLAYALETMGFEYRTALARVTYRRDAPGPWSHAVILVACGGAEWLVDAGFGGPGLSAPVMFRAGEEFVQNGVRFRLLGDVDGDVHLQRKVADRWVGLYLISRRRVLPIDIEVANHFVSTWARSPFRTTFMCVRPVQTGLSMLHGTDLVSLDAQLQFIESDPIGNRSGLKEVMWSIFGVKVEDDIAERAWDTVVREAAARE